VGLLINEKVFGNKQFIVCMAGIILQTQLSFSTAFILFLTRSAFSSYTTYYGYFLGE